MHFHKWGKWEQYEHHYSMTPGIIAPIAVQGKIFNCIDIRQRRYCLKCNKMQDRLVKASDR